MRPDELSEPESRLWRAFARGIEVDLRPRPGGPAVSVTEGKTWGPERTVRAEVIRALLLAAGDGEPGQVRALRLKGARITGRLMLQYSRVDVPVLLRHCWFDEMPDLYWARTNVVNLSESRLPGLLAGHIRVDGMLTLHGTVFDGGLTLSGAAISGGLVLNAAQLNNPGGVAMSAARLEVGGGIVCRGGFSAKGEVRLSNARVGETLNMAGARLSNPGGRALTAWALQVESMVNVGNGFHAEGRLSFTGARIRSLLWLDDATIVNPGDKAISLRHVEVRELDLRPSRIEGAVDLRHARIELLTADPESLPGTVEMDGLTYGALEPHLPADRRLPALWRAPGYLPQPYQQLAATYQSLGHDREARIVRLAAQRHRRASMPWHGRVWSYAQDIAVGYGYRPGRALSWLLILLAVGIITFRANPPRPIGDLPVEPEFNVVVYSLDVLLPIVDLGQERVFQPFGAAQWVAWILIAGGWFLATTVAAGVTRVLSRV